MRRTRGAIFVAFNVLAVACGEGGDWLSDAILLDRLDSHRTLAHLATVGDNIENLTVDKIALR